MGNKRKRVLEEEEDNPLRDERAEWRRLLLKYAGKITGVVEIHANDGNPLTVRTRKVVKDE